MVKRCFKCDTNYDAFFSGYYVIMENDIYKDYKNGWYLLYIYYVVCFFFIILFGCYNNFLLDEEMSFKSWIIC